MRRFSYWLFFISLLALAVFLCAPGPFRNALAGAGLPFLRGKAAVGDAAREKWTSLQPLDERERETLRHYERLLQQLNIQLQQSRLAVEENRELRQYLEISPPTQWRLEVAPVIGRDPYTWNRRFRIGKGAEQGLQLGNAVLAGNQVIGRIQELTANSATVLSIADPACKLSIQIPRANAVGILSGRIDQHWHEPPFCLITFLPRDIDYQAGDYVLTSGLGMAVPAGLPIGRVMSFRDGALKHVIQSAYAEVQLRPGADFDSLRHVAVLVPTPFAPLAPDAPPNFLPPPVVTPPETTAPVVPESEPPSLPAPVPVPVPTPAPDPVPVPDSVPDPVPTTPDGAVG